MLPGARAKKTPTLTSRQAAERLGVKLETLYAYVARGLIRGEAGGKKGAGAQGRRYSVEELDAFQARRRWNRRVVTSAISSMDDGRLLYRGHDVAALAQGASFEQVCALLWRGELGAAGETWPAVERAVVERAIAAVRAVPGVPSLVALQILVAALAAADDARSADDAESVVVTGQRLITRLVAAFAGARGTSFEGASRGPMGARVLSALGGRAGAVGLAGLALVLSAEHELNASTFAARVAASTGADPYAVVVAGIATLSGPKHGGMTDRVEAMLRTRSREPLTLEDDAPLGFGHPLYPGGDPRTLPLLEAVQAARRGKHGPELEYTFALVDAMAARRRPAPTVDVALAATALSLELEEGLASVLFALGRTAGWIAHAMEQYAMGEPIRPRARYVGPAPREG